MGAHRVCPHLADVSAVDAKSWSDGVVLLFLRLLHRRRSVRGRATRQLNGTSLWAGRAVHSLVFISARQLLLAACSVRCPLSVTCMRHHPCYVSLVAAGCLGLPVCTRAGCQFEGSNEIGVFSRLTNAYCLVCVGGSESFYSVFESTLSDHIPVVHCTIAGCRFVGRVAVGTCRPPAALCCGNIPFVRGPGSAAGVREQGLSSGAGTPVVTFLMYFCGRVRDVVAGVRRAVGVGVATTLRGRTTRSV